MTLTIVALDHIIASTEEPVDWNAFYVTALIANERMGKALPEISKAQEDLMLYGTGWLEWDRDGNAHHVPLHRLSRGE